MTNLIDNTRTYFFGRSFFEIMSCFGFDTKSLQGKRVLDCPAGPSSFAAEAFDHAFEVVAFDPVFYRGFEALKTLAYSDYEAMFARVRGKPELFVQKTFDSIEAAEADRYRALEIFLEDYTKNFPHGRYVAGELPSLEFGDDSFDIVLCGHLLFLYAFDFDFHLKSVLEMCRVAKEEVRIHPIVGMGGKDHPMLEPLIEALELRGFFAEVQIVDHEFFKGSNRTLVIRK